MNLQSISTQDMGDAVGFMLLITADPHSWFQRQPGVMMNLPS